MMKRFLGAVLLCITVVGTGCQTELDQARTDIERTWRISKVFRNGDDDTGAYLNNRQDYSLQFSGAGTFLEEYYTTGLADPVQIGGTWVINQSVTQLTLTDQNQSRIYRLDNLNENSMDLTDIGGTTDDLEIKLVPN